MTSLQAKEKLDHIILVQCFAMARAHHQKLVKAAYKRGGDAAVAELGKMVDFERWKERWELHKRKHGLFASVTNQAYEVGGMRVWYDLKDGRKIHWRRPSVDRINNKKTYTYMNMHFPTVETQLRRFQLSTEELEEECMKMLRLRAEAGFP